MELVSYSAFKRSQSLERDLQDAFIGPGYRGASNDHTSLRTICLQRLLVRVLPRLLGQLPIK
jgi:hypothetical protein